MIYPLNDANYMMYVLKHYDNPCCRSQEDLKEDLNRIIYLKRLFEKYRRHKVLKERLILNHIIIFYNVFGIEAATRILFFKIPEKHHGYLKTFLLYLKYIKEDVSYSEWGLSLTSISLDLNIVKVLRSI